MTFFVVSDVHGHYDILKESLEKAGFSLHSDDHVIIACGNMIDFGPQSYETLLFLHDLAKQNRAYCILGNHETHLRYLFEDNLTPSMANLSILGFEETIRSFPGNLYETLDAETWPKIKRYFKDNFQSLYDWVLTWGNYIQTEEFIFTHAGFNPKLNDWRDTDFDTQIFDESGRFLNSDLTRLNIHKTAVFGHYKTRRICRAYNLTEDDGIYIHQDGQKICIDGYVVKPKHINVFITEGSINNDV